MKKDIVDAMNDALFEQKRVISVKVTSPDLWRDLHEVDYLKRYMLRTPGGGLAFAGVPMHYEESPSTTDFELEFA